MKYSIKKQMIAIFIGLLVCMVAVLLFINMTFLEPYYIHNKESSFQEMYEELITCLFLLWTGPPEINIPMYTMKIFC